MKAVIIIFAGTNREQDMAHALRLAGFTPTFIFAHETALPADAKAVFLPGGFSHGDYLRTGAMAAVTPIMQAIKAFANQGGFIMGVCNGFQILCEAGLLPGVLMRNQQGHFICQITPLQMMQTDTVFTADYTKNQIIELPIAHGEGNYFADSETIESLEKKGLVILRYAKNPNGSQHDIAGICNESKNIIGMMPHPENHVDGFQSNQQGLGFFTSLFKKLSA